MTWDESSVGGSLCLVVPAFNDAERAAESIDPLLDFMEAQAPGSELIFVDDGSTDGTGDVVRQRIRARSAHRARVLERPHAGKGAALRAGLHQSTSDVAAFCDVDLATPLPEMARLAATARAESCLAIGSRAIAGADLQARESRRREIAGRLYNSVVRKVLCPGVIDTQCGAKAAPTAIWRHLLPHSRVDGFAWDVEIIALALRAGTVVREMGVEWHHDDRTTVRVLRDGLAMLRVVPPMVRSVRQAPFGPVVLDLDANGVIDLDYVRLAAADSTTSQAR